jgi:chromosome segregation ATPase
MDRRNPDPEREIIELEKQISQLSGELADYDEAVEGLTTDNFNLLGEIRALEDEIRALERQRQRENDILQAEIERLSEFQHENDRLSRQILTLNRDIDDCERDLATARHDNSILARDNGAAGVGEYCQSLSRSRRRGSRAGGGSSIINNKKKRKKRKTKRRKNKK